MFKQKFVKLSLVLSALSCSFFTNLNAEVTQVTKTQITSENIEQEFLNVRNFLENNVEEIFQGVEGLSQKRKTRIIENLKKAEFVAKDNDSRCKDRMTMKLKVRTKEKNLQSLERPKSIALEVLFKANKDHKYRFCYANIRELYGTNSFCAISALSMSMLARENFKVLRKPFVDGLNKVYGNLELSTVNVCKAKGMTHPLLKVE